MTSSERLTKLKALAGKAGESILERLTHVAEVLKDKVFVVSEFGDESKALDALEAEYFGDLCGARSLPELLEVYQAFPTQKSWAKFNWNLTRLLAEWDQRRRSEGAAQREPRERVTKKDLEEAREAKAVADFQVRQVGEQRDKLAKENAELRKRLDEVERDKLQLEAKVEELEKLMDRHLAVRA